jgi:hypothetical protein
MGPLEFLRDVLGDSIDHGQFRSALITIILLFVIWRLSPAGLAQVLIRMIDFAERRSSVGYWLALISVIACWVHADYKSQEEVKQRRQTAMDLQDVCDLLSSKWVRFSQAWKRLSWCW